MAKLKTQPTPQDPHAFIEGLGDEKKKADAFTLLALMQRLTGEPPKMWGSSIVGFGSYHYVYESGREGDSMLTGFSPRKQALSLYIMGGFNGHGGLMEKLGKHKTGKSCLYIKRLSDIDMNVLTELISRSVAYMREKYSQ